MSVLTIEITENHLNLLKHLKCNMRKNDIMITIDAEDGEAIEVTDQNKYEYIDLVLNGKNEEIDPLSFDQFYSYSDEQKAEWDKLYSELPLCLEVILSRQSFECGVYKRRFHLTEWVKVS